MARQKVAAMVTPNIMLKDLLFQIVPRQFLGKATVFGGLLRKI